jgi:GNAT superfamily N-acetyltransferase
MLLREYEGEHPEDGNVTIMNDGGYGVLTDWHFHSFHVVNDKRGKGYAKAILKELIDLADTYNQRVTLTAGASWRTSGLSTEQLVKLYKKFGFRVHRDVGDWSAVSIHKFDYLDARLRMVCMVREPRLRIGSV